MGYSGLLQFGARCLGYKGSSGLLQFGDCLAGYKGSSGLLQFRPFYTAVCGWVTKGAVGYCSSGPWCTVWVGYKGRSWLQQFRVQI